MKKKIIIAIVSIILVVGLLVGGGALLWFKTDVLDFMKPAQTVWNKQVEKALGLEDVKFADYSKVLDELKDIKDKSSKSKFDITANVKSSELDSDTEKLINNSKITVESSTDVANNKSQSKIGLYGNDSEVLTLDVVTNGTTAGIGCSDLYDKYITVSTDDMINYIKKNASKSFKSSDRQSLEILTTVLQNSSKLDLYDLLYISDKDLKHFDKTYRKAFETMIPKKCYSKKSGVTVSVDGKDEKTTAYYLTMNGEDAYEFTKNLTDTIKDDDVLADVLAQKINLIIESSGLSKNLEKSVGISKVNKGQVSLILNMACEKIMEELETLKEYDEQGIKIAVYTKNNKLAKIEFIVFDEDEERTIGTAEYAKSKNIYTLYSGKNEEVLSITDEYSKKTDKEKSGKLTVKAEKKEVATVDYEFVTKKNENKIMLSADITGYDAKFVLDISSKGNYKKEPVSIDGKVSFKYEEEFAEIKFNGTTEFTDVSIPTLDSSNSFSILKATDTQRNAELKKITDKAAKVLPERIKKAYGIDLLNNKSTNVLNKTVTTPSTTVTPKLTVPSTTDTKTTLPSTTELPKVTIPDTNKVPEFNLFN